MKLTQQLNEEEIERLYHATQKALRDWVERLRQEAGDNFPEKVTAFRERMAVHGRYRKPCPDCGFTGAANRLCGKRNELLRPLPDRREATG